MIKWYSFNATKGLSGWGRSGGDLMQVEAHAKQVAQMCNMAVVVYEQEFGRDREPIAIWEPSHADH